MSLSIRVPQELICTILDAHLTSQTETLFGNLLERLAIHVAEIVHNGQKSAATGIDLAFSRNGRRYIVSIKSGPNWRNSSQIAQMRDNFKTATQRIRKGNPDSQVVAVNGCCYGRDARPDKGEYQKLCGQAFWSLISGESDMHERIIG